MQNSITARQVTLKDLDALAPLFDQYRVFYGKPPDLPAARRFLLERFAHNESILFLAEEESSNMAVGFTQLYPSFSSVSMKRLWILNDLFVHEAYRGRKAAVALLHAAKAFAEDTGAKGLELSTAKTNTHAQRLYEQYGYKREADFYTYFFSLES